MTLTTRQKNNIAVTAAIVAAVVFVSWIIGWLFIGFDSPTADIERAAEHKAEAKIFAEQAAEYLSQADALQPEIETIEEELKTNAKQLRHIAIPSDAESIRREFRRLGY